MFKLFALLGLLLVSQPTYADDGPNLTYTIGPSPDGGGIVFAYIAKYWEWHDADAHVRVQGECDSACTLVLGFIPPEHICATANAEFGFHSASRGEAYAKAMTEVMWELYPERVIRLLTPLGLGKAKNHPELIYIDAQKIVQPCDPLPLPVTEATPTPQQGEPK